MPDSPPPVVPSRVPPSNLRAEESVLGAMLLSREAIAEVVETLDPDHFYKPAHGHVYDAIMGLYGAGQPVDVVTVAEELQRASLLEDIGGPALLLDLQASTPAISNAGHYAKIVEEHALLRRLISVSNEIAELAYGVPDDVIKAIDEAEARMFEVAQRRVTNTTAQIKDLLSANLDRLEMLYERGEAITGTSTGYLDLDELLAGLQPNALYVVGARPAMGKALALDTPIPTPTGWSTMGELEVGHEVFDEQGRPTLVTYTSPVQHDRQCFEVVFDDGSVIVADAEHRWLTWDHRARGAEVGPPRSGDRSGPATRTTREIATTLTVGRDRRPNHRIPATGQLDLPEIELPIEPYLLGCWLGRDGPGRSPSHPVAPEIVAVFTTEGFARGLEACGLAGAGHDRPRSIPPRYLRASVKQRLALLQGLMDTGGRVVAGQATCQLSSHDRGLLEGARELALSLGCVAEPLRHEPPDPAPIGSAPDGTELWALCFSADDPVFRSSPQSDRQHTDDGSGGRWRTIVAVRPVASVPVRCITVDSLRHLYLAGRDLIPTHNTAFSLGMAANAAMKDEKPVLFFSLEMSQLELSQRILCSEALVDSSRVKTGRIEEPEWNRISHAVGRLAEAPIYIDDNPHTSVMEIRAKARRLKSRVGDLGMVVVDYIQLMTGRSNAESRQVEVSEISRGLKILARELEAPVVALAQLNRQLEQRVDKRPMLSDLRESGCMPATTRILLADGTETTMGQLLLSQETPMVLAIDGQGKVGTRRLVKTFGSGIKETFRLRLASGRRVESTDNHRFLTADGWLPLGDLAVGSSVAIPRTMPEPAETVEWADDEVVLLAHLLGNGAPVEPVTYTSADEASIEAVVAAARHFGCEAVLGEEGAAGGPGAVRGEGAAGGPGAVRVVLASPTDPAQGRHHPIRDWLESLGAWGGRADERAIPEPVHRLPSKQVARFLSHLWATGGSITLSPNENGRGPTVQCSLATTSEKLAIGVQRLLLRFGIRSTVGAVDEEGCRPGHLLRVEGPSDLLRFATEIGCHGSGGEPAWAALEFLRSARPDPDAPTPSPASAMPDICWDEVIGIDPLGQQPVFDCTVETDHTFIANGIVAHNSLEQDADVVMFLYRDEVYDAQSPDRGVAEVIVAKHRNGPTGRAKLAFRGQYTRFDNMARSVPSGPPPSDPGASSQEF